MTDVDKITLAQLEKEMAKGYSQKQALVNLALNAPAPKKEK